MDRAQQQTLQHQVSSQKRFRSFTLHRLSRRIQKVEGQIAYICCTSPHLRSFPQLSLCRHQHLGLCHQPATIIIIVIIAVTVHQRHHHLPCRHHLPPVHHCHCCYCCHHCNHCYTAITSHPPLPSPSPPIHLSLITYATVSRPSSSTLPLPSPLLCNHHAC